MITNELQLRKRIDRQNLKNRESKNAKRQRQLLSQIASSVSFVDLIPTNVQASAPPMQIDESLPPPSTGCRYRSTVVHFPSWDSSDETHSLDGDSDPSPIASGHSSRFWRRRHWLWHLYDEGVQMDLQGWYSVTPEPIASHLAQRVPPGMLLDAFCGVGGNAIQFALAGHFVVALDLSPHRLSLAQHNARLYSVAQYIDFCAADALHFLQTTPPGLFDCIFLAPPWGGETYQKSDRFSLSRDLQFGPDTDGMALVRLALSLSKRVVLCLPRNQDLSELRTSLGRTFEWERVMVGSSFYMVHVYCGRNLLYY